MDQTPQIKSGYKTSEFYLTLATSGIGLALMLGYISPEQAKTLTEQSKVFIDAITVAMGAVLTVVPILAYLISRIKLKLEASRSATLRTQLPSANAAAKASVPSSAAQLPSAKPSYIVS